MTGLFLVFDGMDGAGKSTAIKQYAQHLSEHGYTVTCTREPGGCDLAEAIRACMLQDWPAGMPVQTELLLVFAARAAHLEQTVLPALARGEVVLCDRFVDSSFVYQGVLGGVDLAWISALAAQTISRQPDCTAIFDLPVEESMRRTGQRGRENRFDKQSLARIETVQQAFRSRVKDNPKTHQLIDAAGDVQQVQNQLRAAFLPHLTSANPEHHE